MPNDQELWAAKVREQNAILGAREKDVQELLWLHAEAVWKLERLRREVEFEANAIDLSGSHPVGHGFVKGDMRCECGEQMADLGQWTDEHWLRFRVCACVSDAEAAALVEAGFTRPQCTVHPENGGVE